MPAGGVRGNSFELGAVRASEVDACSCCIRVIPSLERYSTSGDQASGTRLSCASRNVN